MKTKTGFIFIFLLLISAGLVSAQLKLTGTVTEKNSGVPIAFATVQIKDLKSTLTNESGEFEIVVPAMPATLTVSHLNYQPAALKVTETSNSLKIALVPKVLILKEVAVGNPALAIMQAASDKAFKTYDHATYGKAFLRQIAYEGGKPTYMNEIFMNAEWKPYGLLAWHPTEARHLKTANGISYSNTSFFSFVFSGFLANSSHIKPLLIKTGDYTFKLEGTYAQSGEEIAKIICTPKPKIRGKRFEGVYYINTVTDEVIKIEGVIKGMLFSGMGPISVTNKEAVFIAQFKVNAAGDNVLDYSIFNTRNKLKILGIGAQDTDLFSTLYMVDNEPVNKEELVEVKQTIDDSSVVKAMNFKPDFWKNNQGIKRTEKEQAAIGILENTPQKK